MKKFFALLLCSLTLVLFLVGCGAMEKCDICGKTARCSDIELPGQTIHICKDCKNEINDELFGLFG